MHVHILCLPPSGLVVMFLDLLGFDSCDRHAFRACGHCHINMSKGGRGICEVRLVWPLEGRRHFTFSSHQSWGLWEAHPGHQVQQGPHGCRTLLGSPGLNNGIPKTDCGCDPSVGTASRIGALHDVLDQLDVLMQAPAQE